MGVEENKDFDGYPSYNLTEHNKNITKPDHELRFPTYGGKDSMPYAETSMYIPIESSNIEKAGWKYSEHFNFGCLRVIFRNQRMYDYFPVTKAVFDEFILAESKGVYFSKFIKNNPAVTGEEVFLTPKKRIK